MDCDRGLELLGACSRWKLGLYVLCCSFMGFMGGWHMMAIVFVGMEPDHHCALPDGLSVNESVPEITKDGVTSLDKCNIWSNYSAATNKTTPCANGWEYEPPIHTIVNEWTLVCDQAYLVQTSQTILVVGVMVGALVMATLADKFGRKLVFIGSVVAIALVGVLTSFTQHYIAFAIGRFFTGVFQQGIILAGFVYVIELFPASQRTMAGMVSQCFWAIGMGVMAGFAYASPNWRHFLLCTSVPGFLSLIMLWIIPESVPWLTAKNKTPQAKQVMLTAARVSRVTLPGDFQLNAEEQAQLDSEKDKGLVTRFKECLTDCCAKEEVSSHKDKAAQYTLMDIVKSRKLLIFAIINCYLWCTNTLVYYGLSLSTGSLAGNPYLNFFLSGLVEIPAYIIAAFALKYIGRRWSIFGFHIIAGIPLFVTLFIPVKTADGTDLSGLILALSMIGKFGITGSFGSIFLYAPELFPTTVRNIGLGIASIGGRIGNIIAPFASYVAARVWWLPNVVFGVMAILAALLTLYLPETLNRPLPETIEEVERWTRTVSKEEKLRYKAEKKAMRELNDMQRNGNNDNSLKEPLHTDPIA